MGGTGFPTADQRPRHPPESTKGGRNGIPNTSAMSPLKAGVYQGWEERDSQPEAGGLGEMWSLPRVGGTGFPTRHQKFEHRGESTKGGRNGIPNRDMESEVVL